MKIKSLAFALIAMLAVVAVGIVACRRSGEPPAAGQAATKYQCPMHPKIVQDKPGKCPICGMDLVLVKSAAPKAATKYWCPMHPDVVSDKPGKCDKCGGMELEPMKPTNTQKFQCPMHPNIVQGKEGKCPICGMDLTPAKTAEGTSIPGRAAVELTAQQEELIDLRIEPARKLAAHKMIRAPGRVEPVESKLAHINFRTRGWVEKLHGNFTGQLVKVGDPLLDIYSPDLMLAQRELLFALQLRDKPTTRDDQTAQFNADTLVYAAVKKMDLLGMGEAEIAEIVKTKAVKTVVTLRAPISGYIYHLGVAVKQEVTPEEHIDVADLSTVWVIAQLYENELSLVKTDQEATVLLVGAPDTKFTGKVSYVYPSLDEKTRTGRVRIDVPNPDLALKPQMLATVEIYLPLGESIVVPTEAVFDQGTRQYLFVAKKGGLYEPREVTLGPRAHATVDGKMRDVFVITKGLDVDEKVVVSGNFLLDSESNQRASAGTAPAGHQHGVSPPVPAPAKEEKLEHKH